MRTVNARASRTAVVIVIAASLLTSPRVVVAHNVGANLPGGTSIAVSLDTPVNGSVLPPGPVEVAGTASIGVGQPVASTGLVYVLDVSGSTDNPAITGCGGDQNGDEAANRVLDCEIAAARALNGRAVDARTVGGVGAVVFASAGDTADVGSDEGEQLVTRPGDSDIVGMLTSLYSEFGGDGGARRHSPRNVGVETNFAAGILRTTTVVNALRQSGLPSQVVAFISDGHSTVAGDLDAALATLPATASVYTFAVGAASSCDEPGSQGSLAHIAASARGTCVKVDDVASLPDIVPGVIASRLTSLTLSVDGGPATAITDVTPSVPRNGPTTVAYRASTGSLPAGTHRLCVTASGSDGGGAGSVTDCHSVTLNTPPEVSAGGPYSGLQDTEVPIKGTVVDPDGPNATTAWSIVAGEGADPDARCEFGDAVALSTTVSCDDDGVYTLTLTATDGVTPSVAASTTLTLTNGVPVVSAGGPYSAQEKTPVPITGTVVDPDGPEQTAAWSSAPAEGTPTTATCSFTNAAALATVVTCTDVGVYALTLTVSDSVNPPVAATTTLTLSTTPVVKGPLSLSAEVAPTPGYVGGGDVVVSYTVRNGSPSVMPSVRITTTFAGVLPAPKAVSPAGCLASGAACDLGDLQPGQSVEARITVGAGTAVDAAVSATVTTTGPDTDSADNTASVRVVIRQPSIEVTPRIGPQGFVTRAVGKDFPPGAVVRLSWSAGISPTPGEVVVSADGRVDAQVLVFHRDRVGERLLVAVPVSGPAFGEVRSAPFLVVPRTVQPYGFVTRG
jgi:hypothetical protein